MTIAFGAIGAKATTGDVTQTIAHPTSVAAGNLLLTCRALWLGTATATDETGWTSTADLAGGTGTADDAHTTRVRVDRRVAEDAETGGVTFDQAGGVTGVAGVMLRYTKATGMAWDVAAATADDNTHGSNQTATLATALNVEAGDVLVAVAAVDTNTSLANVRNFIFSGTATFGTATRRTSGAGTSAGEDGNIEVFDVEVTAPGTCTSFNYVSDTSRCGPTAIVRLREVVDGDPPASILNRRIIGTTGLIRTRTTNATSARLRIGTDSAVTTGIVHTTAQTPDGTGHSTHDTTTLGLTAGAVYYFRVEMTDAAANVTLDTGSVGTFRVTPTGATSFSFSFGSCCDFDLLPGGQDDSAALAQVATLDDDLFIHLGDMWYADNTGTGAPNFRVRMASRLDATAHSAIFTTRASTYTPSDHDAGMTNDTNSVDDATALANFNTVYREEWPNPAPASGVYYTFTWGRVRFVQLDTRTFRSQQSATDNSAKTLLGATQKAWLFDTLDNATEPLTVIIQEVPWVGAAQTADDSWLGYTTERAEVAAALAGRNIIMLAGDEHSAYYEDGTGSPGGIPVLGGSPFLTTASRKGGPYTVGPFPASGAALTEQYGHVDVTDTGSTITVDYTVVSGAGSNILTASRSYDVGPSEGTASGSWAFTGAAAGQRNPVGTASGMFALSGAALGKRSPVATAGGLFAYAGSALGEAPGSVGPHEGAAAGVWSFAGAAIGKRSPVGTAAGSWTFVGAATNAPPAAHVGRILNARLSAPQATGRTSTLRATGDIT